MQSAPAIAASHSAARAPGPVHCAPTAAPVSNRRGDHSWSSPCANATAHHSCWPLASRSLNFAPSHTPTPRSSRSRSPPGLVRGPQSDRAALYGSSAPSQTDASLSLPHNHTPPSCIYLGPMTIFASSGSPSLSLKLSLPIYRDELVLKQLDFIQLTLPRGPGFIVSLTFDNMWFTQSIAVLKQFLQWGVL